MSRPKASGVMVTGSVAAVTGDTTDRRPRLRQDPVLGVRGLHAGLGEVRVYLDLVHRGHDVGLLQEVRQDIRHEVADTDRADLPVGQQRLQRLTCGDGLVELGGDGLVQQEQVDLVDAELAGALAEGVQRLASLVIWPVAARLPRSLRRSSVGLPGSAL
jgi:hypothetical protein